MRHGVRSSINPIVTLLGLEIGILLGGAVLVETVFNIPGVGRLAYTSIIDSDFSVIQGTVLLAAMFIIVANIVVDIALRVSRPQGALLVSAAGVEPLLRVEDLRVEFPPRTASCTPSTGSPTRCTPGARSGSSASPARARPSPR